MNKIAGYRRMLGLTQNDIAEIFGISTQAYRMKEVGKVNFNKKEMSIFRDMLRKKVFPNITVDDIFFN
ncbi:hypothetical protein MT416_04500 [Mammaliicoccus sciuri]|uniref:helix-turn-helix transcriptional regulator n=1 Tax=Mammaliicoccus sciuri TaxID=1296 RepID=UPI00132F5CA7|nr:hypothetical protein [Mammaliicoccus sciuri]MCJ1748559.1 hypothetical protein [Mammaliicoccus sciuri]